MEMVLVGLWTSVGSASRLPSIQPERSSLEVGRFIGSAFERTAIALCTVPVNGENRGEIRREKPC